MKRKKGIGFTLIELLTVVAIIAILVCLALPTMSRGVILAMKTKCAGNERCLYDGWYAYTLANRSMICDAGTDSRDPTGTNPIGTNLTWAWVGQWNKPERGVIFPYIQNAKPYKCPHPTFDYDITYAASSKMNGQDGQANDFYFKMDAPSKCFVFLEEADYRGYNMGSWMGPRNPTSPSTWSWVDFLAGNHAVGDNICFADGHVEYMVWTDPRTMQWHWGPQHRSCPYSPDAMQIGNAWRFLATDAIYKLN